MKTRTLLSSVVITGLRFPLARCLARSLLGWRQNFNGRLPPTNGFPIAGRAVIVEFLFIAGFRERIVLAIVHILLKPLIASRGGRPPTINRPTTRPRLRAARQFRQGRIRQMLVRTIHIDNLAFVRDQFVGRLESGGGETERIGLEPPVPRRHGTSQPRGRHARVQRRPSRRAATHRRVPSSGKPRQSDFEIEA